ncbi:MAG: caspase family protein [Tannerella sp.]|jgi:hypothetical protein|nr:caspase family protein [Tannerella sp.]
MKTIKYLIIGLLVFQFHALADGKRTLIVAVSNYPVHSGWQTIYANNDASLLESTLKTHGFKSGNIVILRDSLATKRQIVNEITALQQKVKSDDFVIIHFSCHGQLMEDFNGDEPDGLDEALILYDAKMNNIIYNAVNNMGRPCSEILFSFYYENKSMDEKYAEKASKTLKLDDLK